jgi:hypothetical protein
VSELIPNLDALLGELTDTSVGGQDARLLAEAARSAKDVDALDAALAALAESWRDS